MGEFIASLDEIGNRLFWWVAFMNLWVGALFCLALLLDRVFRRHIGPASRMFFYAPVFVRLLLPVAWESPLGFAPELAPASVEAPAVQAIAEVVESVRPTAPDMQPRSEMRTTPSVVAGAPSAQSLASYSFVGTAAVLVYLLGVCVIGTGRFLRRRSLRGLLQQARPARRALQSSTARIKRPPAVRLLEHDRIGPLLYGRLKPTIVFPSAMVAAFDDTALTCIMAHETEHLRRRDPYLVPLMQALTLVVWPVVPLWLAVNRLYRLAELACDAAAIRRLPGIGYREYGEVLLRVADLRTVEHRFSGILNGIGGNELQERISGLGSGRKWPGVVQKPIAFAIALLIIAYSGVAKHAIASPGRDCREIPPVISAVELRDLERDLADAPGDRPLRQQLLQGYVGLSDVWYGRYRSAFVMGRVDESERHRKKAKRLSDQAWEHARKLMMPYEHERQEAMRAGGNAFGLWLEQRFDADDALLLLNAGAARIWSILLSYQLAALVDIPYAEAMLQRSVDLDPSLSGSLGLLILGSVKCATGEFAAPGSAREGHELLKRAIRLTNGENLWIKVNVAEYCAPFLRDRELYIRLLEEVIAWPPGGRFSESNERARELAKTLIGEVDTLLPPLEANPST